MTEPDDLPPARRPRPAGTFRVAAAVIAAAALIGGVLVARGGPSASSSPPSASSSDGAVVPSSGPPSTGSATPAATLIVPSPGTPAMGYLVSPADLADRAAKAAKGIEPWASARADLLADADAALPRAPHPMVNLDIPGTEGPFVDDTATAYGLALAYAVTGDLRYAEAARAYILAWVSTTKRLSNACPGDGGCQTSLIIGRVVPGFVYAADLIRPSSVLSVPDETAFRTWLRDLILPALSIRMSNWGDAGDFSRAVIADYLGDRAGFDRALAEWRTRLDLVAADGHIPEETRRGTSGMSYTQEALQYKVAVARLAELRGIDLWSYVGKQGGSLSKAIGVLTTYWFKPAAWPYDPAVEVPSPSPMWEIAYQHWRDPAWPPIFAADRPFGEFGHSAIRWTTLSNGIPIK